MDLSSVNGDLSSDNLITTLKATITTLEGTVAENVGIATTVVNMHRETLEELQSQLDILEQSRASMNAMENGHAREKATFHAKMDAVADSGHLLKAADRAEVLDQLTLSLRELSLQHEVLVAAEKKSSDTKEAQAKGLIVRAQALIAHAKDAVALEGSVRAAVENELEQRHKEAVSASLLEDGIRVWVSRKNELFTLMTQCIILVDHHQLIIIPTELSLIPDFSSRTQEKDQLLYAETDLEMASIAIDLLGVDEINFIKRKAAVPGVSDHDSPHWELPSRRNCVYIRIGTGTQYFLADRKNEAHSKTWGSLKSTADGSPSLLFETLTNQWKKVKNGPSSHVCNC